MLYFSLNLFLFSLISYLFLKILLLYDSLHVVVIAFRDVVGESFIKELFYL